MPGLRALPATRPLVAAALLLALAGALAQPGSETGRKGHAAPAAALLTSNPAWNELTPAQRSALAPLQHDWPQLDTERKQKWLEVAQRFPKMSPDERQRVQARMSEWSKLSPKERTEARLNYQELRQLTPAERQARWEQYQALPPAQRHELATRAAPASAPERVARGVRNGASAAAPKSNIVSPLPLAAAGVKPVAPTVVQAKPGATTTLMSKRPAPPPHQQPGLPKVAATPGFVDRTTLLPQRGAQAAGTRAPASSAPASHP
jgi:hypothetical protein